VYICTATSPHCYAIRDHTSKLYKQCYVSFDFTGVWTSPSYRLSRIHTADVYIVWRYIVTIRVNKTALFHRRTRTAYVYNGCLAWYNVVLILRIHSSVKCRQLDRLWPTPSQFAEAATDKIHHLWLVQRWNKCIKRDSWICRTGICITRGDVHTAHDEVNAN